MRWHVRKMLLRTDLIRGARSIFILTVLSGASALLSFKSCATMCANSKYEYRLATPRLCRMDLLSLKVSSSMSESESFYVTDGQAPESQKLG